MKSISIDTKNIGNILQLSDIKEMSPEVLNAKRILLEKKGEGGDFLGWLDLPVTAKAEAKRIRELLKEFKVKVFVVVGIGGSYLGARAVIEALRSQFAWIDGSEQTHIIYAGNTLSEDYYWQLMDVLEKQDYAVAVISKSGTTTEPAVAFRLIKEHMVKKYGKDGAAKRTIAITDQNKGALHDIAMQENYHVFTIPDDVGGRFSVLTPVGLLPIAMAGYNIDALLAGAEDMRKLCVAEDDIEKNPAMLYAAIRNMLYRKGRKVEMLVNFTPQLNYISEWWKQLFGESEGKDGKGILPHSLSFTTDLHSMGQYVQDGERIMFETVLSVARPAHNVNIPYDSQNLDGINYLTGKSLTEINHNAESGTIEAHVSGGVPVIRLEMPSIDEYYIGQLLYFFEFACGISGYTLGVNPFNQPGVEAYKRNMFRLLGKPGYER